MDYKINIFVQARMSSSRFPGKMLAPINGIPLIKNIVDSLNKVKDVNKVIIVTSTDPSDEPLVAYLEAIGSNYFRGPLDNVFKRFQSALKLYTCDFLVRICGDSPFINVDLVEFMIGRCKTLQGVELLSNCRFKRFPPGQSVEIIKSETFLSMEEKNLNSFQREHVLPVFYENLEKSKTYFLETRRSYGPVSYCIDTVEDIEKIKKYPIFKFDLGDIS